MESYVVLDSNGHCIGIVSGVNGGICWLLAKAVNPAAARLKKI